MKITLCLLAGFLPLLAAAQTFDEYAGSYRFEAGSRQRIFSDTAYIRSAASASAILQDTVFAFDAVTVVRQEAVQLTVGRKSAPWYEVRYRHGGKSAEGYLWGGALALHADERDGVLFAFGLLSYPQPPTAGDEGWETGQGYNTCVLKARDRSRRVQQCSYSIYPESQFFSLGYADTTAFADPFRKAGPLPAGGKFRLSYSMSGEACGIPSYEMGAVWDGTRIIRLPMLQSGADAGVYSYEEAYVYPGQPGGKAGQLVVRNVSLAYAEEDDAGAVPKKPKRTVTLQAYRWEAGRGRFVKQP